MAVEYFNDLYREHNASPLLQWDYGGFPRVEPSLIMACSKPFNDDQIKEAIFRMGPLKAPGPDGMNALFFQSQKTHLVSWQKVCKPRGSGGLGLRHMKQQNSAFMTKLGWGLVNQKDSLWARVLRGKYHCGNDLIPTTKATSLSSRLWKAVVRNWEHVEGGFEWRVGDGRMINFWTDAWVPSCGRLCDIALASVPTERLNDKIADFVTLSRDWEWHRFEYLVPVHARLKIGAIMPPSNGNGQDRVAWRHSKDGGFSVKSAYSSIAGLSSEDDDVIWRKIWEIKNSSTGECNSGTEDILHVLRDCSKARSIWLCLVKHCHWPIFFNMDLQQWFQLNLCRNLGSINFDWNISFAITCWSIWRWRNEHIFGNGGENTTDPFFVIIHRIRSCSEDFSSSVVSVSRKPTRREEVIKWCPPNEEWVKVNIDGASSRDGERRAACGGIVRDQDGNFIVGFMRNLGSCTSIQAELWGVYSGLVTAQRYGFHRIIIETDSLVACEMVQGVLPHAHLCALLVGHICELLNKEWEVKLQHTYREGNSAADAMARAAYDSNNFLTFVNDPPRDVANFLAFDLYGSGLVRAIV
ncbi:putative ribonuclease H protein At1g65750 family [Senna tora]|uniref:Putative ribonuclease H protein At1g65750 family n=1 Tax=Senna tora TaxID=362788 RepID=A0A834TGD5_9FABA|nr:putative ribonuclease H protein At1g65750 family [Senna tora]